MIKKRRRNSETAKLELLDAVGCTLKNQGYAKLKINTVAEESEMDKTAIYRLFGNFDELLKAYIQKQDFGLSKFEDIDEQEIEDRDFIKQLLVEHFNYINSNKELQEFLIWEMSDKSGIVTQYAKERELMAENILKQKDNILSDFGINSKNIFAIFIAGINFITMHQDKSSFFDVDITQKSDKAELIKTMNWLVDLIFDKYERLKKIDQVVVKIHKKGIDIESIIEITGLTEERVKELIK